MVVLTAPLQEVNVDPEISDFTVNYVFPENNSLPLIFDDLHRETKRYTVMVLNFRKFGWPAQVDNLLLPFFLYKEEIHERMSYYSGDIESSYHRNRDPMF